MGWTEVPDKAAGDVFTEAMWDTYIRDNLNTGVIVKLGGTELASDTAEILFSSINQDFNNLILAGLLRSSHTTSTILNVQFNGDTGANYDVQLGYANAATAGAGESFAQVAARMAFIQGSDAGSGLFCAVMSEIAGYSQGTSQKSLVSRSALKTGTSTGQVSFEADGAHWRSNAAITSIRVFPSNGNLLTGSRLYLYGAP